jgi:acyl-coenzyme A synthetase/AMP-(fatty) acid ligase
VRERLAAYKCPKQIWFVPALPRTANGKLNRKALERP